MRIVKGLVICILFVCIYQINVYAGDTNGNVVIVIDPGHGGTDKTKDFGASNGDIIEKNINMVVANAMKERLEKYDGVVVYLTHDSTETSMTLSKRAQFASQVCADFLFSIHFNGSSLHTKFGSEVWIPSIGDYYKCGYQFGKIVLNDLEDMGLVNRGVKTRIGDDGDEYYGIIRENEHLNIPAVIIEHCYLDNENDDRFYHTDDMLIRLGYTDADAVAKYFGLKSSSLLKDYTNFKKEDIESPSNRILADKTKPEVCKVEKTDVENTYLFTAKDSESDIVYYSYSIDGGNTYSDVLPWKASVLNSDGSESMQISIDKDNMSMILKVYNQYDYGAESDILNIEKTEKENVADTIVHKIKDNTKVLKVILVVFIVLLVALTIIKKKFKL